MNKIAAEAARYKGKTELDKQAVSYLCNRLQLLPKMVSGSFSDLFLTVLEQTRRKYPFVVVGYVVMPEHFHLLIGEPQERTLWVVLQALKL